MNKKEIESKTWLTRDEMVRYLRSLADRMTQGMLKLEALTYIRGRGLPHRFIIDNQAQHPIPPMVPAFTHRVGEGDNTALTGGPEQIGNPRLDAFRL